MKLLFIVTFLWPVFQPRAACPEREQKPAKTVAQQPVEANFINPFISLQ